MDISGGYANYFGLTGQRGLYCTGPEACLYITCIYKQTRILGSTHGEQNFHSFPVENSWKWKNRFYSQNTWNPQISVFLGISLLLWLKRERPEYDPITCFLWFCHYKHLQHYPKQARVQQHNWTYLKSKQSQVNHNTQRLLVGRYIFTKFCWYYFIWKIGPAGACVIAGIGKFPDLSFHSSFQPSPTTCSSWDVNFVKILACLQKNSQFDHGALCLTLWPWAFLPRCLIEFFFFFFSFPPTHSLQSMSVSTILCLGWFLSYFTKNNHYIRHMQKYKESDKDKKACLFWFA